MTRRIETRQKALEILTAISKESMTTQEICDQFDITIDSWRATYKVAVREVSMELGLYVPRPVQSNGYRYTATDQWHGTDATPEIDNGFKFRVRDEYKRAQTSLQHVQAAKHAAVQQGDLVLAAALGDLADMTTGSMALMRNIAERVGVGI